MAQNWGDAECKREGEEANTDHTTPCPTVPCTNHIYRTSYIHWCNPDDHNLATINDVNAELDQVKDMIEHVWSDSTAVVRLAGQASIQGTQGSYEIIQDDNQNPTAYLCKTGNL